MSFDVPFELDVGFDRLYGLEITEIVDGIVRGRVSVRDEIKQPAGLVHGLENIGPGEMRVLGVFRPAGSPAEAYYPDGTKAQY